jgi:hypothetical protein
MKATLLCFSWISHFSSQGIIMPCYNHVAPDIRTSDGQSLFRTVAVISISKEEADSRMHQQAMPQKVGQGKG